MQSLLLLAAALGFAGSVAAQTPPAPEAGIYRSAFDGYRNWRAQEALDWRRLNEEMRQLGGHAGHLRNDTDAAEVAPRPPRAAQAASAMEGAAPHSHGGHTPTGSGKR